MARYGQIAATARYLPEREVSNDDLRRRFEEREARLARQKQERAERMARRKQTLRDKTTQQDRIRASIERAAQRDAGRPDDPEGGASGDT